MYVDDIHEGKRYLIEMDDKLMPVKVIKRYEYANCSVKFWVEHLVSGRRFKACVSHFKRKYPGD